MSKKLLIITLFLSLIFYMFVGGLFGVLKTQNKSQNTRAGLGAPEKSVSPLLPWQFPLTRTIH